MSISNTIDVLELQNHIKEKTGISISGWDLRLMWEMFSADKGEKWLDKEPYLDDADALRDFATGYRLSDGQKEEIAYKRKRRFLGRDKHEQNG